MQTAFAMRIKLHSAWQSAQATLAKKRETEQKLQAGGKPEKVQQAQAEIQEVTDHALCVHWWWQSLTSTDLPF